MRACTQLSTADLKTLGEVHDNFPVFACWGDFILRSFQNQFFACLAQPGKKFESVSLFNTKIPAPAGVRYWHMPGLCENVFYVFVKKS